MLAHANGVARIFNETNEKVWGSYVLDILKSSDIENFLEGLLIFNWTQFCQNKRMKKA